MNFGLLKENLWFFKHFSTALGKQAVKKVWKSKTQSRSVTAALCQWKYTSSLQVSQRLLVLFIQ